MPIRQVSLKYVLGDISKFVRSWGERLTESKSIQMDHALSQPSGKLDFIRLI
jgi:hypothetical protein